MTDPQPSHSFEAIVTHVVDLDKFWVQPTGNGDDRKKLDAIETTLGVNAKIPTKVLNADDYISVKLNDRGWKRARLKQHIQHGLAYIQLIDYGNEEQVPESSVFTLSSEMNTEVLPEQAVFCALAGARPMSSQSSPDVKNYFNGLMMNRGKVQVQAFSIAPNGELLVDIILPDCPSVRNQLLLHQIAVVSQFVTAPYTKNPGIIDPKIGERNGVIVSSITDITNFWVQLRGAEKNISTMMTAMKSMYSANIHTPAQVINIGMLCTVQLGSDWFRAEIKQVLSTGFILVQLKDFGNFQQVTLKQIYPLEASLMKQPFYAIHCGLSGIIPAAPTATGSFSKQLITWFERYAGDKGSYFVAQFMRKEGDKHMIEMFDEPLNGETRTSTIDLLLQNNCAKRIPAAQIQYQPAPPPITAQLGQIGQDMMMQAQQQQMYSGGGGFNMNPLSSQQPMASLQQGMATQSMGAQSMGAGAGMGTQQSMTSQPNPMSYVPPGMQQSQLMQQPQMQHQQPNIQQSAYQQQPIDQVYDPSMVQPRAPRSRPTQRGEAGADVHVGAYEVPHLGFKEEVAVEITNSPTDFVCLLSRYFEDVDHMNDQMMMFYTPQNMTKYALPPSQAKSGMACVAPYVEDSGVTSYRGRIEKITRNEATILFVDYGNVEQVPLQDLKYLMKQFAKVPISHISCAFEGVAPDQGDQWSEGQLKAFSTFFSGTNTNFMARIIGENREGYNVELYNIGDEVNPISVELERRGVFTVRSKQTTDSRSSRGRSRGAASGSRSAVSPVPSPRQRSATPSGENEVLKAGYRTPNIKVASYYDVKVVYISSPGKFSCQLLEQADNLEKLNSDIQQFYDSEEGECMLESLAPFTQCMVLHDTKWSRAYILSATDYGCQVVLVDTQEMVSADPDCLRSLLPKFSKLPVQGIKCGLFGLKSAKGSLWSNDSSRFFSEAVKGNDSLVAMINGESGGRYEIMLTDSSSGTEVVVNALMCVKNFAKSTSKIVTNAMLECEASADDFAMYPVKNGDSFNVKPSYVVSQDEFYLHPEPAGKQIEELQDSIFSHYDSPQSKNDKLTPQVDMYCAACWDDGWYRAKIISIEHGVAQVLFIDYGNTDEVMVSDLRGLNKKFKKFPKYAINCRLEGCDDPETKVQFKKIFVTLVDEDRALHAMFVTRKKEQYLVTLYDGKTSILQQMYKQLYSGGAIGGPNAGLSVSGGPPVASLKDKDLVGISYAESPVMVYIQGSVAEQSLEVLSRDLSNFYSRNQRLIQQPTMGGMCAVQYTEDSLWYRGMITAVMRDGCQIQFIDYGNQEGKRIGEIFELDQQFTSLPAQAVPCSLYGVKQPYQGWAEAKEELLQLDNRTFTVKIEQEGDVPQVELFLSEDGRSLAQELINSGFAMDSLRLTIPSNQVPGIGGSFTVKVCHGDNPGRIYIQNMETAKQLEDLMESIQSQYSNGSQQRLTEQPKIGNVCCTQYAEDGCWYRATIYGITRDNVKVQFADYGNCEDKQPRELYILQDEFCTLTAQAIECSIHGVNIPSNKWTAGMQDQFETAVHEKVYTCKILGRKDCAYTVEMVDTQNKQSLADTISGGGGGAPQAAAQQAPTGFVHPSRGGCDMTAAAPAAAAAPPARPEKVNVTWPPRIDKYNPVEAVVSWGTGPDDFYVNLIDRDNSLDQLQERLQTVYGKGGAKPQRVNRWWYYAVKNPSDDQVYRGKVVDQDRDNPMINFIDYGNEESVPVGNLYELEPYLAEIIGAQAVRCTLDGLDRLMEDGNIREEINTKFEELVTESSVMIKNIIPQAKEKPKNDIELLVKGQSCIDLLEKELAALSGPPDVALCSAEVGAVVKCAIVNAVSPSDFWCQMSGPMARLNEKMKQCTKKLGELPEVDTYCAAVLGAEDDTVYRAKVLAVADGKVTIRCIDYGTEQTLPLQKLFKLKADCADVCSQAFHVTLPLTVLEDKAAEALTKLQSIATNAVNIKLYSCTGDLFTVEISEQPHTTFVAEGLATSTLASLEETCSTLQFPVATSGQGYFISHIDDLATFYVQQNDLDIDTLTATVHAACTSGSLPALKQPTRGSACAAKYSVDGAWYRAMVTDIKQDKKVAIRFVDFGNSETVSNTSLKELPLTLHAVPVAALQCSQSPLPESYTLLTELFTTVAMEKEVTLEPTESGVSVTIEGSLLADVFEKATSYAKLRFTECTLGEVHNVTCPTVESPYSIWVQLAEHSETLTTIMASLAEYCPEAPALLTCGVNTVCAALFQDDEQWYRAVVLEQSATDCNVRFVDYGNTSKVTKDKLKLLTEEHLALPATCLNVRLGDVRPETGEQWSDPVLDKLYELTAEVECEMKLTSYRAQQHVTLSVEGADVATSLGTAGCGARHVPDPAILTVPALDLEGGEVNVVITHVEGVDKVIVQLEEASDTVLELSAATKAAAADLVTVGDLFLPLQCWAKFSADGELYRANVDSFNKSHAEVTFIDYGNADKVPLTDLWYFAPEHVVSAVQGIPVKFEGIKPLKGDSWDAAATKKLTEIVMDQLGTVTFPATQGIVLGSDSLSITMKIEEKDVATQMKGARVARSAVQPPFVAEYPVQTLTQPTLAAVIEVGAKITLALDEGLEELSAKLQDTCVEGHPDYQPGVIAEGSVCCCKFSEDGLWYRGLVKALIQDKATVLFVDYGNSEDKKVSELQLLPAEFDTAPFCFAVSLSNQSELSELEMKFLPKILTDAEVMVAPTGPGAASLSIAEEGAEARDVVALTAEYCAAVGAYPASAPLAVEEVVYLTEVVSPAEWYVQRDGSEESLEAITTALATSSKTVVPAPFVNQPVLGMFDGALYRAIVTEVAPGKSSLWFVDYGNTATVKEVYEVQPSDMVLPPQAIRCSFKNAVPVTGDVFPATAKKSVETIMLEKEILISSVYEDGCVSVLVEEQNVRMTLLNTRVLKDTAETVGQYTFIPLPAHEVEVSVTHTDQNNLFFANRTGGEKEDPEDEGEVEEDNDVVIDTEEYVSTYQTVLEDALPPALEEVAVGALCIVRWEEALYRATVLWLEEGHAKVRFVDYGNTWICPVTSLLACPEPYRGPGLAIPLHGAINDKPVSDLTLYNVLSAGARDGLVQPVTIAIPPPKLLKYKYRKMDIGVEETLYVSVPCKNGLFYCQREEDEETLATLGEQTAALAATPSRPEHVVAGAPVLAQFTDQAWYRAVVQEPVGAGAKVFFVDYGNSETCSKLCAVTPDIMKLPATAIKCQLKDLSFVNVDALETYNTLIIDNAELTITALSKDETHCHTVTAVTAEGTDVSTAVLEMRELVRTVSLRHLPVNAAMPLFCSKFISPSELCFQCEEDTALLDTIGADCLACPKVSLLSHNIDQLCLALYSVDKSYYRARILAVEDASCKVFFIDYGNKETVPHSSLYDISQTLANHAVCGIPAAFHNSVPTAETGWSDSTIKTLSALMSPDAALTVTATSHRVDGLYPVRVSLGAVDLRSKFEEECCEEEVGLTLGRPWYPAAEPLTMFVSVSVSPKEFYCQRGSDEGALAALQALVNLTELTPLKTVNVGDYCVGMSLDSEGLFRAQVLAVEEAVATVKFIDYGNTEDIGTETLYAMAPALYALPVYAVQCTLEGDFDEAKSSKFVEELCYADAEVSITPVSYSDSVCTVSLNSEGKDVKELLDV